MILWFAPDVSSGSLVDLTKPVADGAYCLDEMGVLLAQLRPQSSHVDVDRPGPPVVLVSPDPAQEGVASEDLSGMGGQETEELVLHVGEVEGPSGYLGLVGLEVEHQWAALDYLLLDHPSGPPESVLEARCQLGRVD